MDVFGEWGIGRSERDTPDGDGCPSCALWAAGEGDGMDGDWAETRVVARADRAVVALHDQPFNPGHLIVVPRTHEARLDALPAADAAALARAKRAAFAAVREGLGAPGVNAGTTQGIARPDGPGRDHVVTHVVPRWEGDTGFMAATADTKVIVEGDAAAAERVRGAFAGLPAARGESDRSDPEASTDGPTDASNDSPGPVRLVFD